MKVFSLRPSRVESEAISYIAELATLKTPKPAADAFRTLIEKRLPNVDQDSVAKIWLKLKLHFNADEDLADLKRILTDDWVDTMVQGFENEPMIPMESNASSRISSRTPSTSSV